jgi:hypothetical protein
MIDVPKKIVRTEDETPVAVQIEYEDWKRIEAKLQALLPDSTEADEDTEFEDALNASRGTWTAGDGLEYQRRLRSEWDRSENALDSDA